ncbi:MAG: DUF3047 domain-containing protein [Candidatus Magnetominusculus sp. LBB02]|nr:DUF3047 domain-containing protein [Candidatus Magnetominusculus sp. LBB02]
MKCVESSFSLEREIGNADGGFQYVSWEWKALRLPKSGDVRMRECNDQALQLLIAFESGKVISYVWDSNAPTP